MNYYPYNSRIIFMNFYYPYNSHIIFMNFYYPYNSHIILTNLTNSLCSYENKLNYSHHLLIHIFYHQNKIMKSQNIISTNTMQFTLNSFHIMPHYFSIKQNINNFFMVLFFLFTPFALVTS